VAFLHLYVSSYLQPTTVLFNPISLIAKLQRLENTEAFTAMMTQIEVFGPLKRWYPTTRIHGITTQKTSI